MSAPEIPDERLAELISAAGRALATHGAKIHEIKAVGIALQVAAETGDEMLAEAEAKEAN